MNVDVHPATAVHHNTKPQNWSAQPPANRRHRHWTVTSKGYDITLTIRRVSAPYLSHKSSQPPHKMPQTTRKGNPLLAIEIAGGQVFFSPGDTIVGAVTRHVHLVDPSATLRISLYGRSKTKVEVHRGQSTSTYRGRFNFFGPRGLVSELYRGPIHIPKNDPKGQYWPFAIDIPSELPQDIINQEPQYARFLDANDLESRILPVSCNCDILGFWSTSSENYVEYYLEATLIDSHLATCEAAQPIMIQGRSSPIPITDFALAQNRPARAVVSSYRLVPGMENAKLSFGAKARQVFGSSKVPQYCYSLHVQTPTVLQLGNPHIIPFRVRATVHWDSTSDILQNIAQTLTVKRFSLQLLSQTLVVAPGSYDGHFDSEDNTYTIHTYLWNPLRRELFQEARKDKSEFVGDDQSNDAKRPKASDGDEPPGYEPPPDADTLIVPLDSAPFPLDIGEALGVKLVSPRRNAPMSIYPTFKTFNIKHTHTLHWTLVLNIGEEEVSKSGSNNVVVMAPSEEQ